MTLPTLYADETPKGDTRVPTLKISPPKKWTSINTHELWNYRELLYTFIWRDVKVRYKQTVLGFLWVIIQPLFMMVIFTFFFGKLAGIPSDNVPYPLFVLAALLPWALFSEGITRSTLSIVSNAANMTKVYFPRLIMPLSGVISPLVDFIMSMSVLVVMMVYYGYVPTLMVVFLPIFIVLAMATSFSVGIWASALNVKYRDFQYTIPFLIQIWLFASPVVYPSSLLPESLQFLYNLNPMVAVIEGFRWVLLGTEAPGSGTFISVGLVIALLISGLFYFRRMEQYYSDIV
jgi:lipopolysaccharide transport system permease protein